MIVLRVALAMLVLTWLASTAIAAEIPETWTWTMATPRGPQPALGTFVVQDDQLTGTVTGRLGESPIEDGTVTGDRIAFAISRSLGGGERIVLKFKGVIAGDTITGTIERPAANEYDAPALLAWKATRTSRSEPRRQTTP